MREPLAMSSNELEAVSGSESHILANAPWDTDLVFLPYTDPRHPSPHSFCKVAINHRRTRLRKRKGFPFAEAVAGERSDAPERDSEGKGDLDTSTIIRASILAALERFYGIFDEAYLHLTGALPPDASDGADARNRPAWQDQTVRAASGVKFIDSAPGLKRDSRVYQLDPFLFDDLHSVSRMTVSYTGATRLSKSILKKVLDGFNGMTPADPSTVRRIGALSYAARDALATRNLDALAGVIEHSWRQNKLIRH